MEYSNAETNNLEALFHARIIDTMKKNQAASGSKEAIRFLYALLQSIGTNANNSLAKLKRSMQSMKPNISDFGKKKSSTTYEARWRARDAVVNYYRSQGKNGLPKQRQLKKCC